MRSYSRLATLVSNLPYAGMVLLGAAAIALSFGPEWWAWPLAGAYLAYGIAGALWVMLTICPYCAYHGTRSCPCGYGIVAARLRRKSDVECFAEMFKKRIPVIVPLWLLPVAAGVYSLTRGFSWWLTGALGAFALVAFLVLPLASTAHGCSECPQKEGCPWMSVGRKGRESSARPGDSD